MTNYIVEDCVYLEKQQVWLAVVETSVDDSYVFTIKAGDVLSSGATVTNVEMFNLPLNWQVSGKRRIGLFVDKELHEGMVLEKKNILDETIPVEPSFRDGNPVYWWRVHWDDECFCHVEATDRNEAIDKAYGMMNRGKVWLVRPPESVTIVKNWVILERVNQAGEGT